MFIGGLFAAALATTSLSPLIDLDFTKPGIDPRVTCSRASGATYFDPTGTLQTAASNTLRQDYGGLQVTTNSIRNSQMVGAGAGTPGTLPTNWTASGTSNGLAQQVVGSGSEAGISYLDFRVSGTTTVAGSYVIFFGSSTEATASNGQTWIHSLYLRQVAGSGANISSLSVGWYENTSTGAFIRTSLGNVVVSNVSSSRVSYSAALSGGATVGAIRPGIFVNYPTGVAIDITLRIGAPQLEQGSAATTFVPTSGSINSAIVQPVGARVNMLSNTRSTSVFSLNSGDTLTAATSYDGSNNGFLFNEGTVNSEHFAQWTGPMAGSSGSGVWAYTVGARYTFSTYMKLASGNTGNLRLRIVQDNGAGDSTADFNLATGITSGVSGFITTQTITPVGSGWYRCSVGFSIAQPTSMTANLLFRITDRAGSFVGSGAPVFYFADPQIEVGNIATAVIPTTGAVVNANPIAKGALVEEQRTNSIRNPRAEGSANGTPGTYPTNVAQSNNTGLTPSVIGTGIESGIPYWDVQISGTATAGQNNIFLETPTAVTASNAQAWTLSPYLRLVGGSLANVSSLLVALYEGDSSGATIASGNLATAPTGASLASQRYIYTRTLTGGATVATIRPLIVLNLAAGAVNVTLRIGAPQLEQGSFATSLMLPAAGSPAATTRAADTMSVPQSMGLAGTLALDSSVLGFPQPNNYPGFGLRGSASRFGFFMASNGTVAALSRSTSGGQQAPGIGAALTAGQFTKLAVSVNVSQLCTVRDGVLYAQNSTINYPDNVATLDSAQDAPWNGCVRRVRFWPRALSTTELQQVTS